MSFSRTFTILAPSLSRPVQLLLVFEPLDKDLLYTDQFPIAWKIVKFSKGKYGNSGEIMFTNSLAIATARVNQSNIVIAGSASDASTGDDFWVVDEKGMPTILKQGNSGGSLIEVQNNTTAPQDISFGFIQNQVFNCIQVQTRVGVGLSATFEYTPKLKIYLTSSFKQSEVVKTEIRSTNMLWDNDLSGQPTSFTLNLVEGANGSFKITNGLSVQQATQAANQRFRPVLLAEYEQRGGSIWRFYGEAPVYLEDRQELEDSREGEKKRAPHKLIEYTPSEGEEVEGDHDDNVQLDVDAEVQQDITEPISNQQWWAKAVFKLGGPLLGSAFCTWAYSRFKRITITIDVVSTERRSTFTVDATGASEDLVRATIQDFNRARNEEIPGDLHSSSPAKGKQKPVKVLSVDVTSNVK